MQSQLLNEGQGCAVQGDLEAIPVPMNDCPGPTLLHLDGEVRWSSFWRKAVGWFWAAIARLFYGWVFQFLQDGQWLLESPSLSGVLVCDGVRRWSVKGFSPQLQPWRDTQWGGVGRRWCRSSSWLGQRTSELTLCCLLRSYHHGILKFHVCRYL